MPVAIQFASFFTNFHGFFTSTVGSILPPLSTPTDDAPEGVEVGNLTDGDTSVDTDVSDDDSIAGDDINQVYHLPPFDPLESEIFVPLDLAFEREEGEGYGPDVEVSSRSLNKHYGILISS